jgi:16S rRNA (guanine(1405)-N(7))-methyltransferase
MDQLEQLVTAVLASPKYRHVCAEFVRNVGARELLKRRGLKEAIKGTKNKLHQVGGAYLEDELTYGAWLEMLHGNAPLPLTGEMSPPPGIGGWNDRLRQLCAAFMAHHASTRERLASLDRFYATTLGELAPLRRVLDVACGLNPLAIPWMPLREDAEYYAFDIYHDLAAFLNEYLAFIGVKGWAKACDVIQSPPPKEADVALLLKAIPCLEQVDKAAGHRLLEGLNAACLLVSFPAYSLGGRSKGMVVNYEAHFRELVAGKPWAIRRFEFPTELVFLVNKSGDSVDW